MKLLERVAVMLLSIVKIVLLDSWMLSSLREKELNFWTVYGTLRVVNAEKSLEYLRAWPS